MKRQFVWRKVECSGIACPYGFYYDAKTDRTYCYGHGWVMNGNIEEMPIPISKKDFDIITKNKWLK